MSDRPRFPCLLSYHYFKRWDMSAKLDELFGTDREDVDLFMDSGAFSGLTQGAVINVHDYGRFLQQWQHEFHLMASLDVIGHDEHSANESYRNWRILRDEYGLNVLPIMHIGEPFEMMERYFDAGEQYMALGGLVATPWRIAAPWTVEAFQRARGRAVFHGFGVSGFKSLCNLPWYTVDHTSWQSGVVFSSLVLFNGRGMKVYRVGKHVNTAQSREFNELCRWYGFDPAEVRVCVERKDILRIVQFSSLSVQRLEAWLRDRHGLVQHPDETRQPGLRVFLATGQPLYLPPARSIRWEHPQNALVQRGRRG